VMVTVWWGSHVRAKVHILWHLGSKENAKNGSWTRYNVQSHTSSDFRALSKPFILKFASPPDNAIKLWIHQWVYLLIKLVPSWASHLPEVTALGTKTSTHKPLWDISDLNHNREHCLFLCGCF
jgi:hypothetical protein